MKLILTYALLCAVLSPLVSSASTLNVGRFGLAAVEMDDAIYVMGGYARGGLVGSVERIDSATGTAELLDVSVRPRFFHHAVVYDDRIIIFGGSAPGDEQGRLVESLDPLTGEVTELTQLPRVRNRPRGWVLDNRLYIIGGSPTRQQPAAEVDIYDFTTGTWTEGAPKPTATEPAIVYRDGRIYAVAGYDGRNGTTVFEVYDPATDSWESLAPLPVRTSAHSATLAGDRLYVMGDYHQVSRTMVYDFATDRWEMMKLDYRPSRHHAALWHNEELWVIGGNVDRQTRLEWIQRFPAAELAEVATRDVVPADDLTDVMTRPAQAVVPGHHPLSGRIEQWVESLAEIDAIQIRWYRRHEHELMGELGAPTLLCEFLYDGAQNYSLYIPERKLTISSCPDGIQLRSGLVKAHYVVESEKDEQELERLLETLNIPFDIAAFIVSDAREFMERRVRTQQWRSLGDREDGDQVVSQMRLASLLPFTTTRGQGGYIDIDPRTGLWLAIRALADEAGDDIDAQDPVAELLGATRTVIASEREFAAPDTDRIRLATRQEGDSAAASVMNVHRRPARACGVRTRTPVADADALLNNPAPDFTLKLLDGSEFTLADHRGQVVVLDFWATWCGPCVRALPHMRTLAEEFADEDVVIVGISRDRAGQERQVQRVLEQHEITYPNGIDVDDIGPRYGVRGIPNVVLIDREGVIRSRKVGFSERTMQQLKSEIRTWLE